MLNVSAAAMAMALLTAGAPGRRPVVLTTDCGVEVDDQWALAHLALSPELDLRGVVTTHAPTLADPAAEASARAARDLLARLPLRERPPVLPGSSRPLEDASHPLVNPGVDFLLEQARGRTAEDRLTVVVIGAATDVASALLVDPTLAGRIAIVAMGFDRWPEGGDPWNVKNDVKAWRVLLESPAPIVVGDVAVTKRHLAMTSAQAHALFDAVAGPDFPLSADLDAWLARSGKMAASQTGSATTWPIWDEVAVAHLLGLTTTETRPRPRLRDDRAFDHARPHGTIEWVTAIDSDRLWTDLVAKVRKARGGP